MLVISVITTLCTTGIAFYLRFMCALCKEWTPRWTHYRKPTRLRLEELQTGKLMPSKPRHPRAPLQIAKITINTTLNELRRDPV